MATSITYVWRIKQHLKLFQTRSDVIVPEYVAEIVNVQRLRLNEQIFVGVKGIVIIVRELTKMNLVSLQMVVIVRTVTKIEANLKMDNITKIDRAVQRWFFFYSNINHKYKLTKYYNQQEHTYCYLGCYKNTMLEKNLWKKLPNWENKNTKRERKYIYIYIYMYLYTYICMYYIYKPSNLTEARRVSYIMWFLLIPKQFGKSFFLLG